MKYFSSTILFLLLVLTSCGKKVPDDILPPEKMEAVLYEHQFSNALRMELPYGTMENRKAFWSYINKKHGVTQAEFDSSMVWYTRHSSYLNDVYKEVQNRFQRDIQLLEKQENVLIAKKTSLSGDSMDVWQDFTLHLLSSSPLNDKLIFAIQADTTYKPLDKFSLESHLTFFPSAPTQHAIVALSIVFTNDSIIGITKQIKESGFHQLTLQPDSAYEIRTVKGFVYLPKGKKTNSLLLNRLKLMRYHNQAQPKEEKKEEQKALNDSLGQAAIDSITR